MKRLGKNLAACNPGTFSELCYADAIETVKHFPAADVEPVRCGRWELHGNDDDISASYFCSLCGYNFDEDEFLDRWSHIRYCPNCGAKMKGAENE